MLTEEEAAAVERERAEWVERIDAAENGSVPGNDIHTRVFLDFGTQTVADRRRSSLITDPPNGRRSPMTPEGETRPRNAGSFGNHALESIEDFSLSDRCMAATGVPLNPLPHSSYVQPDHPVRAIVDRDEEPIFEYACHEGNYGLTNMLRVARHAEAAAGKSGR